MSSTDRPAKSLEDLMRATGPSRDLCKSGILSGQLPGYKVGTRWTIPADAFDDLCRGRWVPHHRTFVEVVTPPSESDTPPTAPDFIKKRGA